jgi:hypothetical protein
VLLMSSPITCVHRVLANYGEGDNANSDLWHTKRALAQNVAGGSGVTMPVQVNAVIQ